MSARVPGAGRTGWCWPVCQVAGRAACAGQIAGSCIAPVGAGQIARSRSHRLAPVRLPGAGHVAWHRSDCQEPVTSLGTGQIAGGQSCRLLSGQIADVGLSARGRPGAPSGRVIILYNFPEDM